MEPRTGRIQGAVQRLLEGQKSAPETPANNLFGEVKKDTHPQDDAPHQAKPFTPTVELLDALEALTAEAGPTLEILQEQAHGSKINGAVLENAAVSQLRMEAIKWLSSQFASFGFRDEWLADAILYMDRMAVQMHKSENFHPLGLERNSSAAEIQGAMQAMKSQDLWLASVMIALKMSEAESELDTSIQDLVVPLVPFDPAGLKCNRQRWQKIKLTEFFVVRELDSRLMVPTALHFVQHLSRKLQHTAAAAKADWPGLEIVKLPKLVGPLPNKEQEESKEKDPTDERRLCKLQALAQYLADMAVAHRPSHVYGDNLSPAVLAVAVLRLCLYAWGPAPEGCEACLDELQAELGIDSTADEGPRRLLAEVYRLWQRVPAGFVSPVIDRWRKRDCKLPPAPSQEDLSPLLQQWCCFLTPLKKKQEPKDLSVTPGSRPAVPEELDSSKPAAATNAGEVQPEARELFPDAPACPQEERPDPMLDSVESTHDKNSQVPADLVETADMEEDTDLASAEPMDVDTSPEKKDIGDTVAVPEVPATSEALTEALESKEVDLPKVSTLEIPIKEESPAPAAPVKNLVFRLRPVNPLPIGAADPNLVSAIVQPQDKAQPPPWTNLGWINKELNQMAPPTATPSGALPPGDIPPCQPAECPQGPGVRKLDGAKAQDDTKAAVAESQPSQASQALHQLFATPPAALPAKRSFLELLMGQKKSNADLTSQSKDQLQSEPGLQSVVEKMSGRAVNPKAKGRAKAKPTAKPGAPARSLSSDAFFEPATSISPTTRRNVGKRKGGYGQVQNPMLKKYKGTNAVPVPSAAPSIPRVSAPARDHCQAFSVAKVQPVQPQQQAFPQTVNTPAATVYNWSPERNLSPMTRSKAYTYHNRFQKALQGNNKEEIKESLEQLPLGLRGKEDDLKAEERLIDLEREEALAKMEPENWKRGLQKGNDPYGFLSKDIKCGDEFWRSRSAKARTVD